MNKETSHRIRLGIFVTAGLLLLIVGMYFIGDNKNMFGRTFHVYTTFRNVSGLQTGNNVRFSGIDVGTVNSIDILSDSTIRVEMVIDLEVKKFMRKNATASIGTDGLMGNKLINIDPVDKPAPLIEAGDEIRVSLGVDPEQMLRKLDVTTGNVTDISADLKVLTGNINKSKGTLYTVLMDTTLAAGLRSTLQNIHDISENLNTFSEGLAGIIEDIRSGKGTLGAMLDDSSHMASSFRMSLNNIEQSSKQLSDVTAGLNEAVNQINRQQGPAGVLLGDTAAARHLRLTMANLDSSVANFNENMKALRENWLFRNYFRNQEKNK